MVKDKRYATVKKLIAANAITSFSEILDTIPKTRLAKDLGMHHYTLSSLLSNPELFSFDQAFAIAALIEVDDKKIVDLIFSETRRLKKLKKTK